MPRPVTVATTLSCMARQPRLTQPPGLFHVTSRGNDRQLLFRCDQDHQVFYRLLQDSCPPRDVHVLSHCLMDNHFHLLVEAGVSQLSRGMQRLKSGYATYVNTVYRRTGHVFERRFHSVPVLDDRQLAAVVRYIARNPVRAGLCDRPEHWRWSSAGAMARGDASPSAQIDVVAHSRLTALLGRVPATLWGDE